MNSNKPREMLAAQPAGVAANEEYMPNAAVASLATIGWDPAEVWRTRVLAKQRKFVSSTAEKTSDGLG